MDFKGAVEFLEKYDSYNKTGKMAGDYSFNLDRMRIFLKEWGVDFSKIKFVHVAGSKGKGYVTNLVANYLGKIGKKVGVFTSPHLLHICERIRINDEFLSEDDFVRYVEEIEKLVEHNEKVKPLRLGYFEYTWVMALRAFVEKGCEYAAVEVGLGGRLDATNIIDGEVSALTLVELEHTAILGDTLEKIIGEKVAIRSLNKPFVVGSQLPEARKILEELLGNESNFYPVWRGEKGLFEALNLTFDNAADGSNVMTVFFILEKLLGEVDGNVFKEVVQNFSLLGRWHLIEDGKSLVVCDVAHTVESIKNFNNTFKKRFSGENSAVVLALMNDKKYQDIITDLGAVFQKLYFTLSDKVRGLDPKIMLEFAESKGFAAEVVDLSSQKIDELALEYGVLAVLGSFTIVEKVLKWKVVN